MPISKNTPSPDGGSRTRTPTLSPTQLYQKAGIGAPQANELFRKMVARNKASRVQAADTSNLANTGGGGRPSGGIAAPVSTLASLPQTPELLALIQQALLQRE